MESGESRGLPRMRGSSLLLCRAVMVPSAIVVQTFLPCTYKLSRKQQLPWVPMRLSILTSSGWLRTGTFYSKNACPQGSEYEYSATDFVWCSRSKYIDFSPRSLNRTKIAYRYTIYIKIMRRPKSWRFSASFTDFLATLTHMTRALHGRARI